MFKPNFRKKEGCFRNGKCIDVKKNFRHNLIIRLTAGALALLLCVLSAVTRSPKVSADWASSFAVGQCNYSDAAVSAAEIDAYFPESYRAPLKAILAAHPNWSFKAMYTGFTRARLFDHEAAPAYSATKKMQSTYLSALAQLSRMEHIPVQFTDIRPGFVATDILNPDKHYPMLMSKEKAADHVMKALRRKKRVYTFDWHFKLATFVWRLTPRYIWERITWIKS